MPNSDRLGKGAKADLEGSNEEVEGCNKVATVREQESAEGALHMDPPRVYRVSLSFKSTLCLIVPTPLLRSVNASSGQLPRQSFVRKLHPPSVQMGSSGSMYHHLNTYESRAHHHTPLTFLQNLGTKEICFISRSRILQTILNEE